MLVLKCQEAEHEYEDVQKLLLTQNLVTCQNKDDTETTTPACGSQAQKHSVLQTQITSCFGIYDVTKQDVPGLDTGDEVEPCK